MRGSHNVTVGLVVLGYYLTQTYFPALTSRLPLANLERWHIAIIYCLCFGVAFRRYGYCLAIVFATAACDMLVILQQPSTVDGHPAGANIFRGLSTQFLPVNLLLFVFYPLAFFASTFDSYNLVKDVAALSNRRFPAYLLSLFSFIALSRIRFGDIAENLRIRGVDIHSRFWRLWFARRWTIPLIASLYQGAAYSTEYREMVGCSLGAFPRFDRQRRVSLPQRIALVVILFLFLLRVVW